MRAFRAWALAAASTVALAVVVTGGAGCSSSSDSSPGGAQGAAGEMGWTFASELSGSRLRAKVLTGGGAREVIGFFDTARKEDCTFQETGDGKWRCLPATVPLSGAFFADAQCTKSLLTVPACAADPRYATSFGGVGCNSRVITALYRVTGPATTTYSPTGTGCQLFSAASSQQKAFTLGEQVSLEEFVSATESPIDNGVVTETMLLAADGARQHFGYRATGFFNASCTFQVMADGVARCLPRTQQSQILYFDSECTTPAFTYGGSSPSCGDSEVLVREPALASGCSTTRNVFRLGDPAPTSSSSSTSSGSTFDPPADAPQLYSGNPGSTTSCYPTSYYNSGSARSLLNVTASLPATGRIGRGTSRLVPALVTRAGSDELVQGWFDTERNVDCSFTTASDGKVRCLPTGPNGVVFFTDTACKSPGRAATRGGPLSCAQAAAKHVRVTETPTPNAAGTCPGTVGATPATRVYELTGELKNLGPSSYEVSPGRCAQVQGVNAAFDAKELDPALFVEGIPGTE